MAAISPGFSDKNALPVGKPNRCRHIVRLLPSFLVLRPGRAPLVSRVAGFTSPCSTPLEEGGVVSTSVGGLYQGGHFLVRAVGPFCTGDGALEVLCAAGGSAAVR